MDPVETTAAMFPGFESRMLDGDGARIHARVGGNGPPVLLVHGYPETGVMWHKVAPKLAEQFTVVIPDLRGYGDSEKPPGGAEAYSKRVMATDFVAVMAGLGHDRFAVVGHDRGGRVSYRMALDHPDRVERLCVLDIVPTIEQWESVSGPAVRFLWHWSFLSQPSPIPETMIGPTRVFVLDKMLGAWAGSPESITTEARAAYHAAWADDANIAGSCDDYRAGATIDAELDRADREAGNKISCPVLAIWGDPKGTRSLLDVWSRWSDDVTGVGLPCGHFIPEEAPDELLVNLLPFLSQAGTGG